MVVPPVSVDGQERRLAKMRHDHRNKWVLGALNDGAESCLNVYLNRISQGNGPSHFVRSIGKSDERRAQRVSLTSVADITAVACHMTGVASAFSRNIPVRRRQRS